ncbi:ankyrin repeat-containing protein ITN1-like [Rhododendron vialii]|uniref:ankyrin repeat-containing protein ITN1-like n=1 Tax=Rhododendron vialii TaxID=182163 RepID=UPI00265ED3A1|nr:ankyrin repeat-containing protein ITN1-like [Rhododendron vialii]
MEELLCDAAMRGDLALLYDIIARDVYILDRVLVGNLAGVLDMELGAALHVASAKGHIEIVKALVKVSPEMCLAHDRDGNNPLHIAAINGQWKLAMRCAWLVTEKLLLNKGDKEFVNSTDIKGNNILHLAVFGKRCEDLTKAMEKRKRRTATITEMKATGSDEGEERRPTETRANQRRLAQRRRTWVNSGVRNTKVCTSEPSDRASDGSDLISIMNNSRSLVVKIRFEPLNVRSDGSEVRKAVLGTSLHNTNPKPAPNMQHNAPESVQNPSSSFPLTNKTNF